MPRMFETTSKDAKEVSLLELRTSEGADSVLFAYRGRRTRADATTQWQFILLVVCKWTRET